MHITIVGGGFGGIKAALELAKDQKNQITLISDNPEDSSLLAWIGRSIWMVSAVKKPNNHRTN